MNRCTALAVLIASIGLLPSASRAAEDPSWLSLPEGTLAAVRIRDGRGFVNKLRQRTKFGAVMLAPERWESLADTIRQQDPDEWAEMEADLAEFGLKTSDLGRLFSGDSGLGVVAQPRDGEAPFMVLLAWVNPGEDLATRLYDAIGRIPEESAEDAFPVTRTDLDLAGQAAMHLTFPEVHTPFVAVAAEGEGDDVAEAPKPRLVDQTHLFVYRTGGRLVIGVAPPQAQAQITAMLDAGQDVDYEKATNVDDAMGLYARFLTAHANGDGGFARKTSAVPGMDKALAPGDGVFEMVVDVGGIVTLVKQTPESAMAAPFLDAYGISGLGVIAATTALDGSVMRGASFIQAKAPRPGLLGLMDQEPLPAEVPAWVPADVVNYTHFSLDLGQVYTVIKQITIETFGPMAQQNFAQAEQGAMNMLQASPEKILSSLGQRHVIAQYTPVAVAVPDGGEQMRMPMNRMAMVWQIKDEALWQRIMGMMGMVAQSAQGKMQFAEEQGFSGWRVDHEMLTGGLFLGKGHLVLGIGKGVIEGILSGISSPPVGEASLAGSAAAARAQDLGDLKPGIMYQVSDSNRYMTRMLPLMLDMLTQAAEFEGDDDTALVMTQIKQTLPSDAEMDGMFGVAGGQAQMNADGMEGSSFLELPPAE